MSDFYTGKKVVVTGGAGFIGSHVVEMLVDRGAKVTVPLRSGTKTDFIEPVRDRITLVEADLKDRASADSLMQDQEIVMNLAAAKGGGIANSMQHHGSLFRDNMSPFLQVLDSAREAGVERFLVVSSACVYSKDARQPTPEEDGFVGVPEAANAGYGWSKRMEEYLAQAYAQEFGMKIAIARPYNAYGPRDDFFAEYSHVIPGLIKRIQAGENPLVVWGSGKQTRSFVYATDFARGLLEVCEKYAVADPLNIGSDEEISIGDLASLLIELSGKDIPVVFDTTKPDGPLRRSADTTKAFEKIGFRSEVKLRDGLQKCIEWYRAHL
ncbi:MAG: NAD-dependent epimerase/dehydratase family protein [Minisyncoccota bacterium]